MKNSAAAAREDVQRVSIDAVNDWKRIKSNFSSAAFAALDEILEVSGGSVDKNTLLPHVDQVWRCLTPWPDSTRLHVVGQDSLSRRRSRSHAQMSA